MYVRTYRQTSSSSSTGDQASDPAGVNAYQRTATDVSSSMPTDRAYTDMYRGLGQMGKYTDV